jgi:pimeloyl-ACP methyl ester carboxylesterase
MRGPVKSGDATEQRFMSSRFKVINRLVTVIALSAGVYAQTPRAGRNPLTIRGQEQRIYLYQATSLARHRKILFAPGDAGCRGFAVAIAEQLAKEGYDTYCLDVLHYLESFTGKVILTTEQIASDFNQIARWIEQKDHEPILLVGWSEGAGLDLAAAANAANQVVFNGIIAIGVPEDNILAWRWKDIGAWITKKSPREPAFKSADFIARIAPLPLFVIGSTSTQWVTPDATRKLFSLAHEPKKIAMVTARDHKYRGNTQAFFDVLREALDWVQRQEH